MSNTTNEKRNLVIQTAIKGLKDHMDECEDIVSDVMTFNDAERMQAKEDYDNCVVILEKLTSMLVK